MAQVDFSNAVLDVSKGNLLSYEKLGLQKSIYDSSQSSITSNANIRVIENSSHLTFIYTGQFTQSGTELYISTSYYSSADKWRVSNISFEAGDTYSFAIDVDISVN